MQPQNSQIAKYHDHAHIAKFVSSLGEQIKPLFAQVLMTCDAQGLIGREMFAIDGVKLSSNASKERSGTHEELTHRADRLDKAAAKIVELHQKQDKRGGEQPMDAKRQARIDGLRKEAQRTREFVAKSNKRQNGKGKELKTNVTDPDSAKMATSKGVMQGYAAQAAVDAKHQVIVAADVIGSGSEQTMLLPLIEQSKWVKADETVITADAGYHSDANIQALMDKGIPAMIADNQMRKRDERFSEQAKHKAKDDPLYEKKATQQGQDRPIKFFGPGDFEFKGDNTCRCPGGKQLVSTGTIHKVGKGLRRQDFKANAQDCGSCALRRQCLRHPERTKVRKVAYFHHREIDPNDASHRMREAIDSPRGRALYSRRIGTVEPVFANIRHNKRMSRLNLRGQVKVNTQWHLYCMVHNIEKLANSGWMN